MLYRLRSAIKHNPFVYKGKLLLSAVTPYQPMKGGKERLDQEYERGDWDYLKGIEELPRFSVVVGYCHAFKPEGARILEIGCGEGLLKERLCPSRFARYVGIDISSEAIQRAAARLDEKTAFICEDATVFETQEQFDVIVFNESLEYFADPLALVQRYAGYLAQGGEMIVSMYVGLDTVRAKQIWKQLDSAYPVAAQTRLTTHKDYTWIIKVYQPHAL